MDCLANFVARSVARSRAQLYFLQRIAATSNTIAQRVTPAVTFLGIFAAVLTKVHAHNSWFSYKGALGTGTRLKILQVAEIALLRWPTSVTTQLTFLRHNLLPHGTTYFLTAQFTFSRPNLLSSRHNLLCHGTTYFLTAKVTFYCKNYLFTGHGTFYFLKAQLTFSRRKSIFAAEVQGIRAKEPNPHSAGFPAKIVFVFHHGFWSWRWQWRCGVSMNYSYFR